jgi:hypothetical protein
VGIGISPEARNATISNVSSVRRLADALVLCTTTYYSPDNLSESFGRYCVLIENPADFFRLITAALCFRNYRIREAAFGAVRYDERRFSGLEDPPGPIGFVKPPDKYKDQREFRFLWVPERDVKLKPFLLLAPECARFCRRIA